MKYFTLLTILSFFIISSCTSNAQNTQNTAGTAVKVANHTEAKASNQPFLNVNVTQFKELMNLEDVIILDVRTPQEAAQGKIEGAQVLNLNDRAFVDKLQKLDKSKTYLVYCRSGRRSVAASNIMSQNGFESIYNLKGGFISWQRQ